MGQVGAGQADRAQAGNRLPPKRKAPVWNRNSEWPPLHVPGYGGRGRWSRGVRDGLRWLTAHATSDAPSGKTSSGGNSRFTIRSCMICTAARLLSAEERSTKTHCIADAMMPMSGMLIVCARLRWDSLEPQAQRASHGPPAWPRRRGSCTPSWPARPGTRYGCCGRPRPGAEAHRGRSSAPSSSQRPGSR